MEDSNAMDDAAMQALSEFPENGTAQDVTIWWKKWYLKAGHKRLGRAIVVKAAKLAVTCPKGWDSVG